MSPLRQRMIAAMQMRGFSLRTHESYLAAVRDLAKFTRRAPDTLAPTDLQRYFEDLVLTRQLAPASVSLAYNGIRFLYLNVLAWPAVDVTVALPKRPQRIPDLLTRAGAIVNSGVCLGVRLGSGGQPLLLRWFVGHRNPIFITRPAE